MAKFWSKLGNFFAKASGFHDDARNGSFEWSDLLNPAATFNALFGGNTGNEESVNQLQLEEAERNRQFQQHSADLAWERSKESTQSAYNFQREMRQTAYQDTMADMKAAGLNPILAAQLGPTSTSSVQTAQSFAASGGQANLSDKNTEAELLQSLISLIGTGMMAYSIFGRKR